MRVRAALAAALILASSGCVPGLPIQWNVYVSDGTVAGNDVERKIEMQISPALSAYDSRLKPRPPRCPTRMDLTRAIGHCVLSVSGVDVPIDVALRPGSDFTVSLHNAIFLMPKVAEHDANTIRFDTGVAPRVNCGLPAVRVLAPKTRFRCTVTGNGLPTTIEHSVIGTGGQLFTYNYGGRKSYFTQAMAPYVSLRKAGKPAIMSGAALTKVVEYNFRSQSTPEAAKIIRRLHIACPDAADFSAGRHVACTATVTGGTILTDMWIDSDGTVHSHALRTVAATSDLARSAQHYYQNKIDDVGMHAAIRVDCGVDRIVEIDRNSTLTCALIGSEHPRTVQISFPNFPGGSTRYYVPPLN